MTTSIYLILELLTVGALTVLWEACSNLGTMKSKFPPLSEEGCRPQGEEVTGPEASVISDLAPSCIWYLWNACSTPDSGGLWCPACPCPHGAHSLMRNEALGKQKGKTAMLTSFLKETYMVCENME